MCTGSFPRRGLRQPWFPGSRKHRTASMLDWMPTELMSFEKYRLVTTQDLRCSEQITYTYNQVRLIPPIQPSFRQNPKRQLLYPPQIPNHQTTREPGNPAEPLATAPEKHRLELGRNALLETSLPALWKGPWRAEAGSGQSTGFYQSDFLCGPQTGVGRPRGHQTNLRPTGYPWRERAGPPGSRHPPAPGNRLCLSPPLDEEAALVSQLRNY